MVKSFGDYQKDYNACLSRIRSFLAGARNRSTLTECQRLLEEAKEAATAMHAMAEVEGNMMRISEARQLLERDIGPLAKEVERALNETNREELFYQPPNIDQHSDDVEALIQSSHDMLRESHSVLAETEHIGNQTLLQMGRQRDQLQNANRNLEAIQSVAVQAKNILVSISRRACRSRLALYCMIAVLGAANVFVLYRIYRKHHKQAENHS